NRQPTHIPRHHRISASRKLTDTNLLFHSVTEDSCPKASEQQEITGGSGMFGRARAAAGRRPAIGSHGRGGRGDWVVTMMPGRSDSRAEVRSELLRAKSSTSLRASTARPLRRRRSERPLTDSMFRGHI